MATTTPTKSTTYSAPKAPGAPRKIRRPRPYVPRRVPCKLSASYGADHPLVVASGHKIVTDVLAFESGDVVFLFQRPLGASETRVPGSISPTEYAYANIAEMRNSPDVQRLYADKLPMTLAKLVEETDAWSYLPL